MAAEDVQLRVRTMRDAFRPEIYALVLFGAVDLVQMLSANGLLPREKPEISGRLWFFSPHAVLLNPILVVEAMGELRWNAFVPLLTARLEEHDAASSALSRACAKHGVPREEWVPMLRWLVSEGMEGGFRSIAAGFVLALANGSGPTELALPADSIERTRVVAQMLIAVAQEYGHLGMASVAMELLRSVHTDITFTDQKALMGVFSRSSRRSMEWQLRSSGALQGLIQSWLKGAAAEDADSAEGEGATDINATDLTESDGEGDTAMNVEAGSDLMPPEVADSTDDLTHKELSATEEDGEMEAPPQAVSAYFSGAQQRRNTGVKAAVTPPRQQPARVEKSKGSRGRPKKVLS
jgi:hypothetical protein